MVLQSRRSLTTHPQLQLPLRAARSAAGLPPTQTRERASFARTEEAGCGASYVTYGGLYQHKRKHHPWLMSDASHAAKTKLLSPVQLLESVLYTQTASYPRPQWGLPRRLALRTRDGAPPPFTFGSIM